MPTAELTITYDGEALADGLMDVRELAPSLLAAGSLLQKANRIANGDRAEVSLKVRSEIKSGSFPVDFVVVQHLIDQAKAFLLAHPDIKDARDILETVFFYGAMGKGLFDFIKWLRNRIPEPGQVTFEGDNVTINLGKENITVNKITYNLYEDSDARRAAAAVVAPLSRDGVDSLVVSSGDKKETVTKDDVPSFDFESSADDEIDATSEALLEIVTLSFAPDLKWRFFDGGRNFTADLADEDFWKLIDAHQVHFSEGDHLRVLLRTRTFSVNGILKQSRSVVKVLAHIPRPRQASLLPKPDDLTLKRKFRFDESAE